ncbi:glycoside hydrolase family 127 protein [Microbacterium sp. EYE_5]|uniref:glycoside hydrolase family 127 protein n=1 Tax=unclassified Microbacterium TaxID=2609290 RepID=UPI0020052E9B|nr:MULTISPECIES: beta-L-arabinofuranosidase domain-containing protein [unclassified Microbacterium]MCK6080236.1 glycoside hydrolase family 127 protein [Microbacterium sp. EYE_382]MCK6085507.1 glycoside hydrolase family 127 protein [Microbacterium sp. EYE_384]MCK6122268.1 glycoside hydrolase family 127 protein [Microbacterium sp. EYE_80]MCK6126270.1 glycoside hydrolase family 127 protein [Microbacterium sp. EYE_79]MCK6141191.1 glycoside hydrolase family 127 protein [Microbacterium sp. EYE_39]
MPSTTGTTPAASPTGATSTTAPVLSGPVAPAVPSNGRLRPLGLTEVRLTDGFWNELQARNASATIPHIRARLESEGWLPNFDLAAAGALPGGRRGREFSDSEVFKYLEALAWELGRRPDDRAEEEFRRTVARIAAAQESDGYLNTMFGRTGQDPRWSALEWGHELYCLGHLFQAAVARSRTRPDADDGLVDVARRAADLVCRTFGDGGIERVCGHAEVETGLAELGRALAEPRYIAQASLFIDRRGRGTLADIEWGRSYFQDDVPVLEADALRGHAVRANYLAAGAVDVAVEQGDDDLLDAVRRQTAHAVARRTYLTGGQGSHHQDEAFGEDWELPPDRAYSETCAGVSSVMLSWRLLLADGATAHADLIERTLFNVVATAVGDDGRSFFYANTLHQRTPGQAVDPSGTSPRASSSLRAPWFDVSCCPPNVARTLAALGSYVATADDEGVQLHQYAAAEIRTRAPFGEPIGLRVETVYPEQGTILVHVTETPAAPWTLSLRVPSWAGGATLVDGGSRRAVDPGRVDVRRAFRVGDVIELHLPMAPRVTHPHPLIDAVRGCVAVERGPVVYALESVDLGASVDTAVVAADVCPEERDGGIWVAVGVRDAGSAPWPYGDPDASGVAPASVRLVPYRDWGNRGPSTMRVWLPTTS